MPFRALRYLALTTLLALAAMARADQVTSHVDLVCNATANLALVRFTLSDDATPSYPRLPQALDRGLSASSGSDRTDCTLANGTTIRVRGGEGQAFAYGVGGGNPPAFFSLWINQRKIFSRRTWKPGYGDADDAPTYDGALITNKRITICATADGKPQRCSSQPLDLARAPVDRVEYGRNAHPTPVGHFSIIAKGEANRRFCQAYLDRLKPGIENALGGERSSLDIDVAAPAEQRQLDSAIARSGLIELSPGVSRRLMMWSGDNHYFDGAAIALAPPAMTLQNINAAYPFENIESWPQRAAPAGMTLISGGQKQLYPGVSPRYVKLVAQRIDGMLYLFAYPTNNRVRPTAALVKPLADGGFATLCAFNRTEPHF